MPDGYHRTRRARSHSGAVVAGSTIQGVRGLVLRHRGHQVDRTPNAVRVLIGRERLVHLNALDAIGGNRIHLDVAHGYFH